MPPHRVRLFGASSLAESRRQQLANSGLSHTELGSPIAEVGESSCRWLRRREEACIDRRLGPAILGRGSQTRCREVFSESVI